MGAELLRVAFYSDANQRAARVAPRLTTKPSLAHQFLDVRAAEDRQEFSQLLEPNAVTALGAGVLQNQPFHAFPVERVASRVSAGLVLRLVESL
jgi:hypothetical protein